MKKRLLILSSLFLLKFASAASSLSEALSNIDSSLIILSSVFVISFLLINFSLSKIFKEQKSTATIISVILSFLIIYGINSSGWDIESFFFDLGFSEDFLLTVAPLIILAGIIYLFIKVPKKQNVFYILGALLIAVGFFIFRTAAEIVVAGVVLIIFGLIIGPILKFIKNIFGIKSKSKIDYKDKGTGI